MRRASHVGILLLALVVAAGVVFWSVWPTPAPPTRNPVPRTQSGATPNPDRDVPKAVRADAPDRDDAEETATPPEVPAEEQDLPFDDWARGRDAEALRRKLRAYFSVADLDPHVVSLSSEADMRGAFDFARQTWIQRKFLEEELMDLTSKLVTRKKDAGDVVVGPEPRPRHPDEYFATGARLVDGESKKLTVRIMPGEFPRFDRMRSQIRALDREIAWTLWKFLWRKERGG